MINHSHEKNEIQFLFRKAKRFVGLILLGYRAGWALVGQSTDARWETPRLPI